MAGLAGVSDSVIRRAKTILKMLEAEGGGKGSPPAQNELRADDQISLLDMGGGEIARILRDTDINTMTPIEAMNLLFELKRKV